MTWYSMKLSCVRIIFPNQKICLGVSSLWLVALVFFWCHGLTACPSMLVHFLAKFYFELTKHPIPCPHWQAMSWLLQVSCKNWQCYKEYILCCTLWCHYNAIYHFPAIPSQKTPHSSPVRLSYGVSFVGFNSDLYSASSDICDIGPGLCIKLLS